MPLPMRRPWGVLAGAAPGGRLAAGWRLRMVTFCIAVSPALPVPGDKQLDIEGTETHHAGVVSNHRVLAAGDSEFPVSTPSQFRRAFQEQWPQGAAAAYTYSCRSRQSMRKFSSASDCSAACAPLTAAHFGACCRNLTSSWAQGSAPLFAAGVDAPTSSSSTTTEALMAAALAEDGPDLTDPSVCRANAARAGLDFLRADRVVLPFSRPAQVWLGRQPSALAVEHSQDSHSLLHLHIVCYPPTHPPRFWPNTRRLVQPQNQCMEPARG